MSILDFFDSAEDRWEQALSDAYEEGQEAAMDFMTEAELKEAFDQGFGDALTNDGKA